ncbi:diguanylate cyclase [Erwinia sp. JUb26]|uniref:GGDEF domain-containing protein n=1 Tax=Erwinia sp. JUb26 TaxID=2485126 RepID=UPI000F460081|nr:diguanylate cyclase [Erwinia sp. JUb26]ROR06299.1 diguanylate cyclase (GGDEF)-like protein [Erwinia sp. JUb26]
MQTKIYDELLNSKRRLSLMLFLFLNIVTALFLSLRATSHTPLTACAPTLLIAIFSVALLARLLINPAAQIQRLNSVALFTGILWAWHIFSRFHYQFYIADNYLLVALVSVFFISAIALGDHLLAFCLHALPTAATVLILDGGRNTLLMLFTVTLPLVGFTLHHLMLRRLDNFTRRLLSQLYAEKESYSDLSMLDPLTGLYNRRGLTNRLQSILEKHSGNHFVLLLDIDNFKAYNDNYGHTMGDQALIRVSTAIRDAVRSRDVVTRFGGEEFLVLLTNVNETIAMQLAERIRQYVVNLEISHRFNDKVSTHVTLSAGIAPLEGDDFNTALTNADRALYLAKNQGRNMLLSWQDLMHSTQPQAADPQNVFTGGK